MQRKVTNVRYTLIAAVVICLITGCSNRTSAGNTTEILWDQYGVPHVYAGNETDMYYAFGWAQMHNHADLLLKLYGQARGRASEYWGEEFLQSDTQTGLFELPGIARTHYQQQNEPFKSYLDAFVKGINDYAEKHPELVSEARKKVLPVTGQDVIAHYIRVLCLEFIGYDELNRAKSTFSNGSNAYAVAPSRSASGNAMLLINPHLAWHDMFLWFEAHLNSPGFSAYGIALVGMPCLSMAFNDTHGWAFTVNTMDGADMYELTPRRNGYLLDGKKKRYKEKDQYIKILQNDGSFKTKKLRHRYSVHGPVMGEHNGKAYALKLVGMNNTAIYEQFHKMAAANNLAGFESALQLMQNPMFNILYADKHGDIMYIFNGNIPKRREGNFAFWRSTVDGTKSSLIWNTIHPYSELPRVVNPPAGFLQSCNDAPWFCTYPSVLNPDDYPAYMSPKSMTMRSQRAINMIKDNPSVTFEQFVGYKLNTRMETADRFLDDLLAAVEQYPNPVAVEAAAILKNWDRSTEVHSKGAVLFLNWLSKLPRQAIEMPWDFNHPISTPRGIRDGKVAVETLIKAAEEVRTHYGSPDVEWGTVYRFRINDIDFPANGGPGESGVFRTMDFMQDADGKQRAVFGDTFVAAVEFSTPLKAMVLLSYGNATQKGSPHAGDQLELLSAKQLRPALLERSDVLKNSPKQETLPSFKNAQ